MNGKNPLSSLMSLRRVRLEWQTVTCDLALILTTAILCDMIFILVRNLMLDNCQC